LSQLISHTPTWVFIVFFTLIVLGFMQSRERLVKVRTVFILPAAMILFSLFGVSSVFELTLVTISLWAVGLLLTLIIGLKLGYPKAVIFSSQQLTIPGS